MHVNKSTSLSRTDRHACSLSMNSRFRSSEVMSRTVAEASARSPSGCPAGDGASWRSSGDATTADSIGDGALAVGCSKLDSASRLRL